MALKTQPGVWTRFVAVGDSLTEGLVDFDPRTPRAPLGWADRLAVKLAGHAAAHGQTLTYANTAVRGRLMADIAGHQIDQALALAPDLVAVWGGGNDCLRPNATVAAVARQLEDGVRRLRATGCDVLLATAYDPSDSAVLRWTAPRSYEFALELWRIAEEYECYVADVWHFPALHDLRMWADDLIHLTTAGHERMAERAYAALGLPATPGYEMPLPPLPPRTPLRWTRDMLHWGQIFLLPWTRRRIAGRSSGDGRVGKRLELAPVDNIVAALAARGTTLGDLR
jgi:lysophospholipase L1-like esterase